MDAYCDAQQVCWQKQRLCSSNSFLFYPFKHSFSWLDSKKASDGCSSDLIILDLFLLNSAAVTTRWHGRFSQYQVSWAEKRRSWKFFPFLVCRPSLIFFSTFFNHQVQHTHTNKHAPQTSCCSETLAQFSFLSFWFQIETKNPNCPTAMLTQCFVNIDDCFISHPLTAFCRWRACLRASNIDFFRYSLFMFIVPKFNQECQAPRTSQCTLHNKK